MKKTARVTVQATTIATTTSTSTTWWWRRGLPSTTHCGCRILRTAGGPAGTRSQSLGSGRRPITTAGGAASSEAAPTPRVRGLFGTTAAVLSLLAVGGVAGFVLGEELRRRAELERAIRPLVLLSDAAVTTTVPLGKRETQVRNSRKGEAHPALFLAVACTHSCWY